jgi:hypothetical protein
MARIMASPEHLEELGAALLSSVGKLRSLSGQSAGAYHQLEWESHRKAHLEEMLSEADKGSISLFDQVEQLAQFLKMKADLFASLDQGMAAAVASIGVGAVGAGVTAAGASGAINAPPSSGMIVQGTFATTSEELSSKFTTPEWKGMSRWSDLIMTASRETGLPPEIIAANMMQESHGNPNENAGALAGKGLMQIEFGAYRNEIPGETDQEKLAWIFKPENNVRFGAQIMKDRLDKWIGKYGQDEGLKRGLQYWNYGPGAANWVEEHCKSSGDWQSWVDNYHDTHKYDHESGQWVTVPSGGDYGTPHHWENVFKFYSELMPAKAGSSQK